MARVTTRVATYNDIATNLTIIRKNMCPPHWFDVVR